MRLKTVKGKMARRLVVYCIFILTIAAIWSMALETIAVIHQVDVDQSEVLVFIGGAFGGELLMLLMKRIFAKSDKEDST